MNKSSGVECSGWFVGFGYIKYGIQVAYPFVIFKREVQSTEPFQV